MTNRPIFKPLVRLIGALSLLSLISTATQADLQTPTMQLCERVKSCAYETLSVQTSDASNQAMLDMLIDGICAQIAAPIAVSLEGGEHEADAQTCLTDALKLDCAALMAGQAQTTQACQRIKSVAETTGATIN